LIHGFCLLLSLSSWAFARVDPECRAIEDAFAVNNLDQLNRAEPHSIQWQALKQFRLAATYIPAEREKEARQEIKSGLKIVNRGISRHPDDVSLLTLGAMLDGQYLLLSPWRFFFNGQRGLSRLRRAEKLDPSNPRVVLVRGTAKIVLPKIFGGNPKDAVKLFEKALATVRQEHRFMDLSVCEYGEWAQVDLLNWLGRAMARQGSKKESMEAYNRALARSPGNYWVQQALANRGYEWETGKKLASGKDHD
jgi:tetratricopeptide (TPR) repeat protein